MRQVLTKEKTPAPSKEDIKNEKAKQKAREKKVEADEDEQARKGARQERIERQLDLKIFLGYTVCSHVESLRMAAMTSSIRHENTVETTACTTCTQRCWVWKDLA